MQKMLDLYEMDFTKSIEANSHNFETRLKLENSKQTVYAQAFESLIKKFPNKLFKNEREIFERLV